MPSRSIDFLPVAVVRRLRQARLNRGIGAATVARSVGTSRAYLCHVEMGRRRLNASMAARYAEAIGVDLAEVLDG